MITKRKVKLHKMAKIEKIGTAIIIENSQGNILLQHRDTNPQIKYPSTWVLFGGGQEHGETPEMAIARELKEEIDIELSNISFYKTFIYEDAEEKHLQYVYYAMADLNLEGVTLKEGDGIGYFKENEIGKLELGFNFRDIIQDFYNYKRKKES